MSATPVLGVLRLDYDYEPALGDVDHPDTFSYDVIYRVIPGLTFEMCQSGDITNDVRLSCIDAVRCLNAKGVSGITGDCGFMIAIEQLVRHYSDKPVFLSSLDQLPLILTSIGPDAEVAVFTANSKSLERIEDRLDRMAGVVPHSPRIHIVGCQDIPGFDAVDKAEKVDTAKVGVGLLKHARGVLDRNADIKSLLLECTELGPYSNALRRMSGLPVYDAITLCNAFMSGFARDESMGAQM